jgi:DnaK suppressor protein
MAIEVGLLRPNRRRESEMLTHEDLRYFRQRLESERDGIKSRIAERRRDSRETVREGSGVGDSGDDATRLNDLEVEADVDEVDRATLTRIQRALGRIDDGTYGVSEISGKPIPKGRLEAVPYATTLVEEPLPEPA